MKSLNTVLTPQIEKMGSGTTFKLVSGEAMKKAYIPYLIFQN